MSVNRSSENKLTHAFLSFLFFSRGFIQIHFGLFDFFVFVLSNKYYLSKLMLLDFRCQKISFLCKHNFCIDEKHTQWHWDTKVKVFHESISWFIKCTWNCISWIALKEKFPSVSFPLRLSWKMKILKIDFQNFLYRERLFYWICFYAWLILLLSMTSAKI